MTILTNVAIDTESFALGEILSDGDTDTRIELTQFVPIDDGFVPYFWGGGGTGGVNWLFWSNVVSGIVVAVLAGWAANR